MATDRWNRVAELFEKAVCAPLPERRELIRRECGDDDELRLQVERLLENDAQAGEDFLVSDSESSWLDGLEIDENGSVGAATGDRRQSDSSHGRSPVHPAGVLNSGPDHLIGRRIGSYTIKQLIAEGGMGAVYLAQQESPRREVALKIMTAGFWSRSAQRRFGFETEILGRLHHPHIAQVYEAGTHELETGSAVPYFAMEYIPGAQPITAYCDGHRLDLRGRLRLFCTVCEAVHYGHQKGVVHRDLKPANILIDEDGHAKVIDFGVARSTDSDVATTTMHTEAGQIIGTLAYMSPEQLGGTGAAPVSPSDIDTRSDVYSLGVLLFELLTGRLPYDISHMTIHAAARVICGQEPARPSEFTRHGGASSVKGDLETIVLTAIEKNAAKRYNSAAALAEDIERYLRGEPIAARPPTRWTKTVSWAGRHPFAVTGVVCLIIVLSTIAATSIIIWRRTFSPHALTRVRAGQALTGVDYGPPADEVRLLALDGNTLHSWTGGTNSIAFAEWVDGPSDVGSGPFAVIGHSRVSTSRFAQSVCVYDLNGNRDIPLWHAEVLSGDVLPQLVNKRDTDAEHFSVQDCLVGDVFTNDTNPGPEIVVSFSTSLSPRVVRVYDLGGRLLYQTWHDGSVGFRRLLEAGHLLCVGDDHQRFWDSEGRPKSPGRAPFAVFALRPCAELINRDGFLNSDRSLSQLRAGNRPSDLIWYKWLYQEGNKLVRPEEFTMDILRSPVRASSKFATITVIANVGNYAVQWNIDEFGKEVPRTRIVGETYKQARLSGRPPLPDPAAFELRDEFPKAVDSEPAH